MGAFFLQFLDWYYTSDATGTARASVAASSYIPPHPSATHAQVLALISLYRSELKLGCWDFFFMSAVLLSIFTLLFSLFVLFHSCCSHGEVFSRTHLHQFNISCSHTEWDLLSSLCDNGVKICKRSAVKLKSTLTIALCPSF